MAARMAARYVALGVMTQRAGGAVRAIFCGGPGAAGSPIPGAHALPRAGTRLMALAPRSAAVGRPAGACCSPVHFAAQ